MPQEAKGGRREESKEAGLDLHPARQSPMQMT